jgi:DNA-binding transcriptional LysR family regulator
VVAQHLSFARAADELHLAQPSLSRQIQRLEQRLGVRLLDRTPHGNHLTAAGRAFLPEAQSLLQAANRAALTARAHSPAGRVTIGYLDDLIITPAVRALREKHPQSTIETRHLNCQALASFEDGLVDVLVARSPLPFPADNLWTKVLYAESRVLVVAHDHPLAGRVSVQLNELSDEKPFPCSLPTVDGWTAYRLLGSDPKPDRPIESYEDKLELVAGGRAIGIQPAGDHRSLLHPGVITIPLTGAPTNEVVVVGSIGDSNPLVEGFRTIAATHLTARKASPANDLHRVPSLIGLRP